MAALFLAVEAGVYGQCTGQAHFIDLLAHQFPCWTPISDQFRDEGILFNLVIDCSYGRAQPNTPQSDFTGRFVDPSRGYADGAATNVGFQLYDVTQTIRIETWDRHGQALYTLWVTPGDPNPRIDLPGTIGGFWISDECIWHINYFRFTTVYEADVTWRLTLPQGESRFARLTEEEFTKTPAIGYQAWLEGTTEGGVTYRQVNSYETSNGKGAYENTNLKEAALGEEVSSYKAMGGIWKVTPSATYSGAPCSFTGPLRIYFVVGSLLPEALVTPYLVSLYTGGATPRLMTGIAQVESTYQQFGVATRYGLREYWPKEADGGGKHVGLMQVDVTQNAPLCFWSWKENASAGARLFFSKLSIARRNMKRIQKANPGLRDLTATEIEKCALVLYRGLPREAVYPKDRFLQYQYFCVDKSKSPPEWLVNTKKNPVGVRYANTVLSSQH